MIACAIEAQASSWTILLLIQVQALFCSPTSSLAGSIVFSRLVRSKRQFGTIRALGTVGWMVGCWTTSFLELDASPRAFYVSSFLWIALGAFTLRVPSQAFSNLGTQPITLRERFGWDALSLLRDHDHRVVFITAALIAIPFAAFYPFTPAHLAELGMERTSAWMSLGQVTEVVALVGMGAILQRWPFKWVVATGIGFGVLRYALYATNTAPLVLLGLFLHGMAFTFTYVSTQIYLAERIKSSWRTRAQALLSLMTGGLGNLTGYLWCGAWLGMCTSEGGVDWSLYWSGLGGLVLLVLLYFSVSYHGSQTDSKDLVK